MYERFSTQARQTVMAARERARMLAHSYVGTEHLLLGLLAQGEGTARTTLQLLAVDTDSIRDQVLALAGTAPGPGPRSRAGQVRFTHGARKVLERSLAKESGLPPGVVIEPRQPRERRRFGRSRDR